jgi:protein O-GlcNAc transferase
MMPRTQLRFTPSSKLSALDLLPFPVTPAKLQSLLQSGLAHHRAGRLAEAESLYRQARTAAPKSFDAVHLSGLVAYQQGRLPEAVELLSRAHTMDRRNAACEMRLALALLGLKKHTEAEAHLRHAVATKPDLHEAWENLAYCLKLQDKIADAVACHQKIVTLVPKLASAWCNYGLTLSLAGRLAEALACHDRALALDPRHAAARYGRAQALHQTHRMAEAVAEYDAFLALEPRHLGARSNRLFALHNLDDIPAERLFAEHLAYGKALGPAPAAPAITQTPEPGRRLRLAVFSPDLRQHSCAYFIEPLLQQLRAAEFEVCLYHDHFREDAVSARLRGRASVWRNFVGQPADAVEQAIRADAPDILIDLAGHTGLDNRLPLFARRLAPVQITYLGYPNTTGVPAMDYRFTDVIADPVGDADAYATEKLIRFAPTAWCYAPPADAPPVTSSPCLINGYVTFGCCNDLSKVTDRTIGFWSRILQGVPNARLRLKGRGLREGPVRVQMYDRLTRAGIDAGRVDLLERTADTRQHLAFYGDVDIALDTFPYHGTTTTCEALWMGVSVVSLVGDRHVSRVGASLLTTLGHPEWIAPNADEYVRTATGLASDGEKLAATRARLREELAGSALCDAKAQSQRFAEALRACWVRWCEQLARG